MSALGTPRLLALGALFACASWGEDARALGDRTPPRVEAMVEETLRGDGFGFCARDDFPLSDAERAYCPLIGRSSKVCPSLPRACAGDARPDLTYAEPIEQTGREYTDYGPPSEKKGSGSGKSGSGSGSNGSGANGSGENASGENASGENGSGNDGSGSDGSGKNGSSSSAKPPPPEPKPTKIEIPGWLAALGQVLFYLLAAGFVAAILYWLAKTFLKGRDRAEPEATSETISPEAAPEAPRGPIETDVDRLLARARAAAQAGDFKAAIEAAYAALLRRLEGDGLVDLHPSRTNGDYVRQLRERPDVKRALREIATDVERMQFGTEQPSPSLFDSVYRRVLPLVGKAAAVLALIGALGSQLSCRARDGTPTLAVGETLKGSTAPLGSRGVFELLERDGKTVEMNRKDELDLALDRAIVILPDAQVDERTWRKLVRWSLTDGGYLIVVGHRSELEDELGWRWARAVSETPVATVYDRAYASGSYELAIPRFSALAPTADETPGAEPLLARFEGDQLAPRLEVYAVTTRSVRGRIVMFADDALFKNLALAAADNAAYLVSFFDEMPPQTIEVWDGFTGAASSSASRGAESPLDSIKESRLAPILLHLAGLILLFLFYKGTRFGTPRDPRAASRRAFSDHARAVGLAYARARASRHALGLYTTWAFDRLRERFGSARKGGMIPLAEAIAQRTGQTPAQVMQVLVEAGGARDEVAPPSSFRGSSPPPADTSAPAGPARDFWLMRRLESFLSTPAQNTSPPPSPPVSETKSHPQQRRHQA